MTYFENPDNPFPAEAVRRETATLRGRLRVWRFRRQLRRSS